ncbi:MAG: ABC transporter substrate-binding protein, partial [Oscillospiraceae bacterium]
GNITGTNDVSPIKEQIELMLKLCPDIKTVGLLYSSSEDNSITQAKQVKEILAQKGLGVVEQTVTSSNDVQQATQSIVDKCDGIYIPTDNTFASAMPIVAAVVKQSKTPVVCGDIGMTQQGGLATLGLNYYNLGYQTGEMGIKILKGEKTATMAVQSLVKYDYIVNADMAQAIGVTIPEDLKQYAK